MRGELIAQERLQDGDPVRVRQVEQRLGMVIAGQAGVRRGPIARADQLTADVLDATRGLWLRATVVDHDRGSALGRDPRVRRRADTRRPHCADSGPVRSEARTVEAEW